MYSYFFLNSRKKITDPSIAITISSPRINGSIGDVDSWGVCVGVGEIMGVGVGVGVVVGVGVGVIVGVGEGLGIEVGFWT